MLKCMAKTEHTVTWEIQVWHLCVCMSTCLIIREPACPDHQTPGNSGVSVSIPGESVSAPEAEASREAGSHRPPLTDIEGEGEAEVKASLGFSNVPGSVGRGPGAEKEGELHQ